MPLLRRPAMRHLRFLPLLAAMLLAGCKGTEDYLADIKTSQNPEGQLNLAVFDAGLLVHEGLTGIMDQDVLTLSQMGRAVHDCGRIVEKNEVALCRADAVELLVHLALRYPLPPLSEPFLPEKSVGDTAFKQIEALEKDSRLLAVEALIQGLSSPDRTVVERNHDQLKQLTGQAWGFDSGPWKEWWAKNRDAVLADVATRSREPIEILAGLRYGTLSNARVVLGYLAVRLQGYDLPDLRAPMTKAIQRIARQVVVHGIALAVRDKEPAVRSAAARAAARVLDPSFSVSLQDQLQREVDADTRVQLLQALRWYPSKATLAALLAGLRDQERTVRIHSRRILAEVVGQDLGPTAEPWLAWYERDGKTLWP